MRSVGVLTAAIALTLMTTATMQTPPSALKDAAEAIGAANVKTLEFTGSGRMFTVGQPPSAHEPWPAVELRNYSASIDYGSGSMRVELLRFMGPVMPRGGGAPFTGEQRQVQVVSGTSAWNVPQMPPGGGTAQAQPAAAAVPERMQLLWSTPHGFVKAAMENNATTRQASGGTEVSFSLNGRKFVGTIDKAHHVERVRTWIANDVLGDMPVEVTYSGYKDFGGVQFPSRILQAQGGYPSLDLTISAVKANPTVDITVPDNVRSAAAPAPPAVQSTKLADGVFYLTGASHHSMAVDMGDHIVVVEAPLNEARSEAVIAETKKLIPNKPIRYVVNTHVHFDHSGGLRTYVDEGATVVTHQANRAFYQKAWSVPRTLNPDRLSKSKKAPKFITVTDKRVLTGAGGRTIELHLIKGNPHNAELLMAWLPADRILFQSDMFQPLNPNQAVPPPSPTLTNFSENLTRLNIKPEQIPGGHGSRAGTMADLNKALGKTAQP